MHNEIKIHLQQKIRATFLRDKENIKYLINQMKILNKIPEETLIILINVNNEIGKIFTERLIGNINLQIEKEKWDKLRREGRVPFFIALIDNRKELISSMSMLGNEIGKKLITYKTAILVVDYDFLDVFSGEDEGLVQEFAQLEN